MTAETIRHVLLWCSVINYAILIVWAVLLKTSHDGLYRWTTYWFHLSVEQFDALHYGGLTLYKLGVILFNVVPCVALYIVV
ncbi:MAG: hypothetical protein U0746_06715 [Gemmataceae bacterium]